MNKLLTFIFIFLLVSPCFAAENLTELDDVRTSRKSSNTFYSGQSASPAYNWQPMTVTYEDTTSGHEVTLFTQTNNKSIFAYVTRPEYGAQWWSADGKRMSFNADLTVPFTSCPSGLPWFIVRSDGTYMRPDDVSSARCSRYQRYYNWSPTEPDVAWHFGLSTYSAENDTLYKITQTDTKSGALTTEWYDTGYSSMDGAFWKDAITGDGKLLASSYGESVAPYYIIDLENQNQSALPDAPYYANWPSMAQATSDWGNSPSTWTVVHDEYFQGNSTRGYWIFAYVGSSYRDHFRINPWGTDGEAPNYVSDTACRYGAYTDDCDWWDGDGGPPSEWDSVNNVPADANKEVQFVGGYDQNPYWPDHFVKGYCTNMNQHYYSHNAYDRYGRAVVMSDPRCYWPGHITIYDFESETELATSGSFYPGYTAWTGFTDYAFGMTNTGHMGMISIKGDSTAHWIANVHNTGGSEYVIPTQSPDGTKVGGRSNWLNPSNPNIFVAVAYYPYPPEITSISATDHIVNVSFNWRTDQTGSERVYNSRGWPDEDASEPPPPRETEKFRLWRSNSASGPWTPLGTVDADIFTRYDFSDGTWESGYSASSIWQITDVPGDGTWYYIVTSVEWSGLESHAPSNIYEIAVSGGSGTGSQDTSYPSDPGDLGDIGDSDIVPAITGFQTANTSIIRHYNIYAQDGSKPSTPLVQEDLIASISKNHCSGGSCSWVDWLGDTDGSTDYYIAAVDTQGNVSAYNFVTNQTKTHQQSPATAAGQYTITWDDMYGAYGYIPWEGQILIK